MDILIGVVTGFIFGLYTNHKLERNRRVRLEQEVDASYNQLYHMKDMAWFKRQAD